MDLLRLLGKRIAGFNSKFYVFFAALSSSLYMGLGCRVWVLGFGRCTYEWLQLQRWVRMALLRLLSIKPARLAGFSSKFYVFFAAFSSSLYMGLGLRDLVKGVGFRV